MKLLRFIKNIGTATCVLFDIDELKSFAVHAIGTLALVVGLVGVSAGLGWIGSLFGLTKYLRPDLQTGFDGLVGLGMAILCFLAIVVMLLFSMFNIAKSIKEIWDRS